MTLWQSNNLKWSRGLFSAPFCLAFYGTFLNINAAILFGRKILAPTPNRKKHLRQNTLSGILFFKNWEKNEIEKYLYFLSNRGSLDLTAPSHTISLWLELRFVDRGPEVSGETRRAIFQGPVAQGAWLAGVLSLSNVLRSVAIFEHLEFRGPDSLLSCWCAEKRRTCRS